MKHPLSRFAPSPLSTRFAGEGDDTLAAGRPLLGVPWWGRATCKGGVRCHRQLIRKYGRWSCGHQDI
ncbi:hypothetical protein F3K36_25225 [Delftia sp. BR1]|nr:hypothetical protein F3K36_25225 [Delftia sp. BR1]